MSATLITLLLAAAFVFGIGVGKLDETFRRSHRHEHNWGRWEKKETAATRYVSAYGVITDRQEYTAVWQERACTTCGYIEREELELP